MRTTNNGPGRGPILWSVGPPSGSDSGVLVLPVAFLCYLTPFVAPPERILRAPSPEGHGIYNDQAIEPAVQYVQKIKNRCDPETYRQFLDILSRYHHKPETIDEVRAQNSTYSDFPDIIFQEEVSRQIARLFKDAPDLRADFRVFMPEQSRQLIDENPLQASPSYRTGTPVNEARNKRKLDAVASSTSLPAKRKRKVPEELIPPKPVRVVTVSVCSSSKNDQNLINGNSLNLLPVWNAQRLDMGTKILQGHLRPICHTIILCQ